MGFGLDGRTGLHREAAADWLIAAPANAGSPQLPYCAPTAPSNRQRWPLAQRATPHPNLGLIATILRPKITQGGSTRTMTPMIMNRHAIPCCYQSMVRVSYRRRCSPIPWVIWIQPRGGVDGCTTETGMASPSLASTINHAALALPESAQKTATPASILVVVT